MARGFLPAAGCRSAESCPIWPRCSTAWRSTETFYSLQRPTSFRAVGATRTPDDFTFAVKAPRFVTPHEEAGRRRGPARELLGPPAWLALREKLGPLLWQLPPNLGFHPDRLAEFLCVCCRDRAARAVWLGAPARRADGRAVPRHDRRGPAVCGHALEVSAPLVRHAGFSRRCCASTRSRSSIADTAGRWPLIDEVTSDSRLPAPARRRRALHQRLHRRGPGTVGRRKVHRVAGRRACTCRCTSTNDVQGSRTPRRPGAGARRVNGGPLSFAFPGGVVAIRRDIATLPPRDGPAGWSLQVERRMDRLGELDLLLGE